MNPLVAMVLPLVVWTAHFVFAYAVAAIVCAKDLPLLALRAAVAIVTVVALVGIGAVARSRAPSPPVGERDGVRGREFFATVTKLIAALAAVAVVYSAAVFIFLRDCR